MPVSGNSAPRRHNRKAVLLGDLIGKVLRSRGLSAPAQHRAVFSAWEKIVPPVISSRCRTVSFRNGKLMIQVESAPLLEELRCFRASEFLGLLNAELSRNSLNIPVQKLEFRRS